MPDLINISNPDQWDFEVEHKYQDVVNRLQWNSVTFNHNGEFLVASTYGQSSHDLYVWETSLGSLVKILEGSNEELIDVKWNYSRCTIGSTGLDSGMIYLWSIKFPQKWSALAPDFVEIEENIEYQEKEDEFDIIDEDELNKKRLEEEDEVVDVITPETTDARGFDVTTKSFIIPVDYAKSTVV
jgi:COMPASS component SWD1